MVDKMTQDAPSPETPEQVHHYVKTHYAFGLPNGSVRALLALLIFGGIWGWMWRQPDTEVPAYLRDLMFIIMGHYFASRRPAGRDIGPPPLYLPRGSVRAVLLLGFVVVAGLLIYQHRMIASDNRLLRLNHAGVTMILVAGFMLGVLMSHMKGKAPSRRMEDLRATGSLVAGVVLLLLAFDFVHFPDLGKMPHFQRWALHYRLEDILAAVVGFYFGSRS